MIAWNFDGKPMACCPGTILRVGQLRTILHRRGVQQEPLEFWLDSPKEGTRRIYDGDTFLAVPGMSVAVVYGD
jgi:hypothetical protein